MLSYTGPDGIEYTLAHLAPHHQVFRLLIKDEVLEVPIRIVYRDHCYSREMAAGDDQRWLIPTNGGRSAARLFCTDRWSFSHSLPPTMQMILSGRPTCYRTTEKGLYFKIDRSQRQSQNQDAGWYVFFRLSPNSDDPLGLKLSVESLHERTTMPANNRGRQNLPFWKAVKEFLMARPHILQAIRNAKGP